MRSLIFALQHGKFLLYHRYGVLFLDCAGRLCYSVWIYLSVGGFREVICLHAWRFSCTVLLSWGSQVQGHTDTKALRHTTSANLRAILIFLNCFAWSLSSWRINKFSAWPIVLVHGHAKQLFELILLQCLILMQVALPLTFPLVLLLHEILDHAGLIHLFSKLLFRGFHQEFFL